LRSGLSIKDPFRLIKAIRNWYDIPLFMLGLKRQVIAELRKGPRFEFIPGLFKIEMFLDEPYSRLDVHNRVVVDIGALNGDSAIYFSIRGARRVVAFEPYPFAAKVAERNVRLNGIPNIEVRNEAIGQQEGHIRVDSGMTDASSKVGPSEQGSLIPVHTLQNVTVTLSLQNAALKMDCEGCEYGALANTSDEVLLKFDEIMLEFHNGLRDLSERLLRIGFDVEILKPNGNVSTGPPEKMGLIYAWRRKSSGAGYS